MFNEKDNSEFLNKKIIVTGASSGIGLSVALYFLNCGAQVILVGRDISTMKSICQKYNFQNAIIMKLDLSKDINIYDFKSSVVERFQTIDIIVNCAGVKLDGDIEKTFPQDFDYTIDINLRSVLIIIKTLIEFMNKNSSIINISCLYGNRPMYGMISHNISKAGLETLTKYAAAEYANKQIRINAIAACPVDTNAMRLIKVNNNEYQNFKEHMKKNIPLGRIANPDDIVRAVSFLASKRSGKITGQVIRVDGGRGLTSSGYVHYRGMKNMNARFEPDDVKMGEWIGGIKKNIIGEPKIYPILDQNELKKFIEDKINESNFSTRLSDAHLNINSNYKMVEVNDQYLKNKFLGDQQGNKLLEKRMENYDGPQFNYEN